MEHFGINVDVNVDTGESSSKVEQLSKQLDEISKLKTSKINLDLGLKDKDVKNLEKLINLTKDIGNNKLFNAFEVSDKSLNSLKQLKETAEQIAKLNIKQAGLMNEVALTSEGKKADNLVSQYKSAQKEIKALQSQLSKTSDNQVISSLTSQLGNKYTDLDKLYKKMSHSQKESVKAVDTENIEQLERVYGKVFDSIQSKARKMQTQLQEISKSELVNKDELAKTEALLNSVLNMNFKKSQELGFEPFSTALKDLEKLKTSISELNKGSKLDGFNQSDLVKEWKNLHNIINATKKDLAGTTNENSVIALSNRMRELNKDLDECYKKMSDVDKKTVDTIANFDKIKLDNGFTKSAEKILSDVKNLENSLNGINKKGVFDDSQLQGYKKTIKEITSTLNSGIAKGALNEFNLSYAKGQVEKLEDSFKRLGEVAERELKISKFTSGMETQLASMKGKFKDALPDKEIENIRKEFAKLDIVSIGKLPQAFDDINKKVQELRANAENTSKTFKEFETVGGSLREVSDRFEKLSKAGALDTKEITEYSNKLKNISQVLSGMDLKDVNANAILKNMLGDINAIGTELNSIKIPDFLGQWKNLNKELTTFKKALSTAYDGSSITKLENDIQRTENAMSSLEQKMNRAQKDESEYLSLKSDRDISEYFRKQADESIKEIDKIMSKLGQLGEADITDIGSIEKLSKTLAELKSDLGNGIEMGSLDGGSIRTFNNLIQDSKNEVNALEQAIKEMNKNVETSGLIKEYSNLSKELNNAQIQMSKMKTPEGLQHWEKEIKKIETSMTTLREKMSNTEIGFANKIDTGNLNKLSNAFSKEIDKIRADAERLNESIGKIGEVGNIDTGKLSALENKIKEISNALSDEGLSGKQLAELKSHLQSVATEVQGLEKISDFSSRIESELKSLESAVDSPRITIAIRQIREELENLNNMPSGSNGIEKQMQGIEKSLKGVQRTAQQTGTFFDDLYDSMRTFTLGNMIGDAIQNGVYAIKDTLVGFDSAIRDMMKVAPADFTGTSEQLKQVKNDAIETAKSVGKSSEDVIQGMAKALQTGAKNMQDAMEIAKSSTIFANVGDLDQGTADTYIASIMSAFGGMENALKPVRVQVKGMGDDYNNLTNFLDQANYAGNNFAVSTGDIGEALQKSGSILSNYGVTMDESIALIIGAQESVQNAGKVGTSLKTMASRFAGIKANAKDGTMELNKTAKTLKEIAGIDIYSDKSTGQVKDMMEILQDLNGVWDSLTEDKQLAIGEAVAGLEHANTFQALMGNWEAVLRYQEEYNQGFTVGSAQEEQDRYLDSIEGKLNILKENMKDLLTTTITSDMFKGALDGLIAFTDGLNNVMKALDKMGMTVPVIFGSIAGIFSGFKGSNSLSLLTTGFTKDMTLMQKGMMATKDAGTLLGGALSKAGGFLKNFLMQGALIAGVTIGVQLLAKAWDNATNALANAEKEITNSIDEIQGSIKEDTANLTYLEDIESRYNELIQKKKEYGSTPIESMTDEQIAEMEELKSITAELAEMFPNLVMGYDSEGSPILLMADDMTKLQEKTKEQIRLQEELLASKRKELGDNARKQIQKGEKTKDSIEEELHRNQFLLDEKARQTREGQDAILRAIADGDEKALKRSKERYESNLKMSDSYHQKQLELQQEYIQKELQAQQTAYDSIKKKKGFDKLEGDNLSNLNQFVDNMNWGSLDDKQYNAWINGSQKLVDLANSGSPKLEQWNSKLEKANAVYSANGDLKEYEKSISSLAKVISKELNMDYSTVFEGLKGMEIELSQADQAMQNFLKSVGKSRYELLNGDVGAKAMAEQFQGVQEIFESLATKENAIKANGTISYEMATEIANKDSLPDDFQNLVNDLKVDGVTEKESEVIIDILAVLNEGKTDEAEAKIKEINEKLKALGKDPISIDALFDVEGAEKLAETESKLDKLRNEGKVTKETEIIVNGQDKAELYLQIIQKIKGEPEMTNKFILDNQDALSKMKTIEEVKKYLQDNPEIANKYSLTVEGVEKVEDAKNKKKELEKDGEAKTKVTADTKDASNEIDKVNEKKKELEKETKLTVNKGELQGSAEEFSKLVEYSTKLKDGTYSISFKSDTADAITQIENLRAKINELSTSFANIPSKTVNINTAQSAQNLSGLITRINQTKSALDTLSMKNVNINTAQSAQNLSGLIVRVQQYTSAIDGVLSRNVNVNTAQSAKNLSGLIRKIQEYNGTPVKNINIKTNASSVASQIRGVTNALRSMPSSKTVTVRINQKGSVPSASSLKPRSLPTPVSVPISTFATQVQTDTIGIQRSVTEGVYSAINDTPTTFNAPRATIKTPIEVTGQNVKHSLKYSIELLKELENRIEAVGNQLSVLDKKMEHATGKEKLKYLEEQNVLYKEQLQLQRELGTKLKEQQNHTKNFLKEKGFQFTADGNLKNYEEKLIAMEKEADRLEEIASRDKASDKQKKASENYKKSLDEVKKYLESYLDITFSELPKVEEEFANINNAIKDNINSIQDYKDEMKDLHEDSGYKNHDRDIKSVQNELDKNEIALETAKGEEKNKLLKERVELYKKLQKETEELLEFEEQRKKNLTDTLNQEYGFTFRDDGSIVNYGNKIAQLKESLPEEEFNRVFEMVEDYFETSLEKIPELQKEWLEQKNTINESTEAVSKLKQELKDLNVDSGYKNHERDLAEIKNLLEKNETLLDGAGGSEYTDLLSERIELVKRYQKELKDMIGYQNSVRNDLMGDLGNYGFSFRDDGSIVNYGNVIAKLKENLSEEEFEKVFAKIEEYLDLTLDKIPDLENEWLDANNQIKEHQEELEELVRQRALDVYLNKIKDIENEYDKLADRLDVIDIKLKHAFGKEKLDLLDKQIAILEEQRKKQTQLEKEYKAMLGIYAIDLKKFGINFDENGDITNLDEVLNNHINSADYEKLKKLVDEYLEIQRDKLPEVEKDWEKLNSQIKDAYKEQLEVTKDIEDKITQVYKKQVEERKKLIDEELKKRLDALKKEQDAYNDARKEADYKKDYDEQLGVIEDLQKQLDIAMKDDSLSGQKKVQELLKKLKEEQKKLEEMVQDKIDDQVNDMFDKESERLENESEAEKDRLDKEFSDENLKQIVKDALTNGVFVDIDGNIKDLEETLLEFEDKFGDGMTAIGEIIKSELVTNLEIAKETMKEFTEILDKLDLGQFSTSASQLALDGGYGSNNYTQSNSSIEFNSPLLVVEGNVTKDVMEELKGLAINLKNQITKDIVKHIK